MKSRVLGGVGLVLAAGMFVGCGAAPTDIENDSSEAVEAMLRLPPPNCDDLTSYTASLAWATIDCIGTISPDSYAVDANGYLRRRFASCLGDLRNKGVGIGKQGDFARSFPDTRSPGIKAIDDLLGLQYRRETLPTARVCIAGQWERWRQRFLAEGNTTCPYWKLRKPLQTFSPNEVGAIAAGLPRPPFERQDVNAGKQSFLYEVAYADKPDLEQPCGRAESCAKQCTDGFPGFYVDTTNDGLIGDPRPWLTDMAFYPNDASTNPFMQNGYYHAMSAFRGAPGDLYGNRNRVSEDCTRWVAGPNMSYKGSLKIDCIPDIPDSCLSICTLTP